ncbi:MAG: membrane protein insertase YidC, partial [Bacteroidota bacterium]
MDRNTIIGFGLIFLMLIGMQYFQNQNRVEAEAAQRVQDSIALVQHQQDSIAQALEAEKAQEAKQLDPSQQVLLDSLQQLQRAQSFGGFAAASTGQEEEVILENDVLKVTFSNKGGRITSVLLKEYFKMGTVEEGDKKYPLYLLEDERNKFEYTLPLNNGTKVSTSDLFFDVERSGNSIVFRAKASDDQFFEQKYTLTDGSYAIGYDLKTNGLDNLLASSADEIQLNWENYLTKIERNVDYERRMSSVYFKTVDDDTDYCNCNKSDIERIEDERITWIAHSSQFFNSALMTTDAPFQSGVMETVVPEADADVTYLKKLISEVNIPTEELSDGFNMQFYVGPK